MRVMVLHKASEDIGSVAEPTPEMLEAFAAMDRLTEEMVAAGVFVAAAGLKNAEGKRLVFDGKQRRVIDGPFAETRELVAGWSIWEVKDMDEAMAWAQRAPMVLPGEIEIRPFYEAEDLAGFMSAEELAAPRDGERGKLGVA